MTQTEWIISLDDDLKDYDELFVGNVRDGDELIRCKDCKYWKTNTQFCSVFSGLCTVQRMPPDGYCSEADRKEE